jgi:hypothetical protein
MRAKRPANAWKETYECMERDLLIIIMHMKNTCGQTDGKGIPSEAATNT